MEPLPPLRPYQERELARWRARPDKRLLLAWEMGGGKTYAALHAVHETNPETLLCVVPAILRPMWRDLLTRYFSDGGGLRRIGTIRKNRSSTGATKADKAAWEAPWKIVSYDLLEAVADLEERYDFIIFDEAHALRNPLSKQSKAASRICLHSVGHFSLGLSGTYIPNEAYQLWNPLKTFFPNERWLGRPSSRTGDVPWSFKERYCNMEMRHGHPYFYGLREDAREALQNQVAPYVSRITQEEFARYLPPLFVEALRVDVGGKDVAKTWLAALPEEVTHRGIFTHTRDKARAIAAEFRGTLITGEDSPEVRAVKLQQLRESPGGLLVGTIDSLSEGISLSFIKAALVCEWTTEMSTLLQFIGRFARADSISQAPTKVEIVVGPNDVERLGTLRTRIDAANAIFTGGRAERVLMGAVERRQYVGDEFVAETLRLVGQIEQTERRRGLIDDDDTEDN